MPDEKKPEGEQKLSEKSKESTDKSLSDNKKDIAALLEKVSAMEKIISDFRSSKTKESTDKSLDEKVKDDLSNKEAKVASDKTLEAALEFNLTSERFLKENNAVLPKEINEIFSKAKDEKFDSHIERANATKSAIINSFFSQQANFDLLTKTHADALSDYFKLTKKAKEDKAESIFKNIFEPTVSMLKRVKKAEETAKANAGILEGSDFEKAYANKLRKHSEKYLLGKDK